nr:low temperature requirement protein A [Pseudonocardia acidicola]
MLSANQHGNGTSGGDRHVVPCSRPGPAGNIGTWRRHGGPGWRGAPIRTVLWWCRVGYAWLCNLRLNAPGHVAERHGLIIIVALGESIVATTRRCGTRSGTTASTGTDPVRPAGGGPGCRIRPPVPPPAPGSRRPGR